MNYLISGFCPRTDIDMGCHGFCIYLAPGWKSLVAASEITADNIQRFVGRDGRAWLDACGFDAIYDPDDCGFRGLDDEGNENKPKSPPGPNSRPMYEPNQALRVLWGEWGPEHITVPGNACGLDIDRDAFGSPFRDGAALYPHNIDSWRQKQLLLVTFTAIAENVVWLSLGKSVEGLR